MINREPMVKALERVPDALSVIRFVDGFYRLPVEGAFVVDQTAAPERVHATVRIPKNTMTQKGWLRWVILGDVDHTDGSPEDFTLRFRWGDGGPIILGGVATAAGGSGTVLPWRLLAEIQCGPPGTATQILIWATMFWQPGPVAGIFYGGGTFDTVSKNVKLNFSVELTAAHPGTHFRTIGSYMETF